MRCKITIHRSVFSFFALTCLVTFLSGCATVSLNNLDYPLIDIQRGVSNIVPKGVLKISPNGRTYTSKYFDPNSINAERTSSAGDEILRERATVVVTILGDRRPYDVDIQVQVEGDESGEKPKKNDDFIEGEWSGVGSDKGLARHLRDRLANYLARLERNKNIIDDFRPF